MTAIAEFSLQAHPGRYGKRPLSSVLLCHNNPTGARLPGYVLRYQFRTPEGFLFLTDFDCAMEEETCFTLLSADLRCLSRRSLGGLTFRRFLRPSSFWLRRACPLDDHSLAFTFDLEDEWLLRIRPWEVPFLRPRLVLPPLPIRAA